MKKILVIATVVLFVIGCSKKVSPSASNSSSSGVANTNGVVTTSSSSSPMAVSEAKTPPASEAVAKTVDGATSAKTTREAKPLSIEQQGQATYNAKCGRCHGLKVNYRLHSGEMDYCYASNGNKGKPF